MKTTIKGEELVFRKFVSLFLVVFLFIHFSISLTYNFSEASDQTPLVKEYMDPLFVQNFKIFAPDVPTAYYQLYFKYSTSVKKRSIYQNAGTSYFSNFLYNRFSADRYRFLLYKEAIRELQYAEEAAQYYAKKNKINQKHFLDFRTKFLTTTSTLNFSKKFLVHCIEQEISNKYYNQMKACIVTNRIPAFDNNFRNSAVLKRDFSFYSFTSSF